MKLRAVVFLVLLSLSEAALGQESNADIFMQANQLYESGDYTSAINLYESLVTVGVRDYVLFFNLGNAYYETRLLGKALLNYRRAQMLTPRDSDLNTNTALVLRARVDIQGDETTLIDSLAALTSGIVTVKELSWLALFLWVLFLAMSMIFVFREQKRGILRAPLLVAAAVAFSLILLLGSRLYVMSNRPTAVVIRDVASALSGPGDDYIEIYRLHSAAELRVLERRNDWVRFILPDQRQGWIKADLITIV